MWLAYRSALKPSVSGEAALPVEWSLSLAPSSVARPLRRVRFETITPNFEEAMRDNRFQFNESFLERYSEECDASMSQGKIGLRSVGSSGNVNIFCHNSKQGSRESRYMKIELNPRTSIAVTRLNLVHGTQKKRSAWDISRQIV